MRLTLQVLITERDSRITEMEAASSGEAVRLKASVETVKGEIVHLRHEHEKEKESWEADIQTLKTKLEAAESNCICAEIEAAKMRSQMEFEVSVQTRLLNTRDSDLAAAREEVYKNFHFLVNVARETVAAYVLAGTCGSISSEAMGSFIQNDDDETCSDNSSGEMDPSEWTDGEKSIFIQALLGWKRSGLVFLIEYYPDHRPCY